MCLFSKTQHKHIRTNIYTHSTHTHRAQNLGNAAWIILGLLLPRTISLEVLPSDPCLHWWHGTVACHTLCRQCVSWTLTPNISHFAHPRCRRTEWCGWRSLLVWVVVWTLVTVSLPVELHNWLLCWWSHRLHCLRNLISGACVVYFCLCTKSLTVLNKSVLTWL